MTDTEKKMVKFLTKTEDQLKYLQDKLENTNYQLVKPESTSTAQKIKTAYHNGELAAIGFRSDETDVEAHQKTKEDVLALSKEYGIPFGMMTHLYSANIENEDVFDATSLIKDKGDIWFCDTFKGMEFEIVTTIGVTNGPDIKTSQGNTKCYVVDYPSPVQHPHSEWYSVLGTRTEEKRPASLDDYPFHIIMMIALLFSSITVFHGVNIWFNVESWLIFIMTNLVACTLSDYLIGEIYDPVSYYEYTPFSSQLKKDEYDPSIRNASFLLRTDLNSLLEEKKEDEEKDKSTLLYCMGSFPGGNFSWVDHSALGKFVDEFGARCSEPEEKKESNLKSEEEHPEEKESDLKSEEDHPEEMYESPENSSSESEPKSDEDWESIEKEELEAKEDVETKQEDIKEEVKEEVEAEQEDIKEEDIKEEDIKEEED